MLGVAHSLAESRLVVVMSPNHVGGRGKHGSATENSTPDRIPAARFLAASEPDDQPNNTQQHGLNGRLLRANQNERMPANTEF